MGLLREQPSEELFPESPADKAGQLSSLIKCDLLIIIWYSVSPPDKGDLGGFLIRLELE